MNICKNCKHSHLPPEAQSGDILVCRRFPPVPVVLPRMVRVTGNAPPFDVKYIHPLVNDGMTCGEFSVKLAVMN